MDVYLLRHAIAVAHGTAGYREKDRPVTDEGRKKMEKAAQGIVALGIEVDAILTSPLVRAAETAEIAAAAMSRKERVIVCPELAPGHAPQTLFAALSHYKNNNSLLLVGHEPDLSSVAAALLHAEGLSIKFKKGGLCHIEVPDMPPSHPGTLLWHVTPEQLRLMGQK